MFIYIFVQPRVQVPDKRTQPPGQVKHSPCTHTVAGLTVSARDTDSGRRSEDRHHGGNQRRSSLSLRGLRLVARRTGRCVDSRPCAHRPEAEPAVQQQ